MEQRADAVAGEVTDHAVPETLGVALDDPADDVERPAGRHRADRSVECLLGSLDQQPRLFVDLADQERRVRVAVHAADERGDVDVEDVALDGLRRIGDAVADDLVQRGAQRLRVAAVPQRRRVGAVVTQELVTDAIEFVGGHAGHDVAADFGERLGCEPPGDAHRRDRLGVLDLDLAALLPVRLADVVRPLDGQRDVAACGLDARAQHDAATGSSDGCMHVSLRAATLTDRRAQIDAAAAPGRAGRPPLRRDVVPSAFVEQWY